MRRPAPGSPRGVLTGLLAVLLMLAGTLTGSASSARPAGAKGGEGTPQAGRYTDHDGVSAGSTRLTSSRVRTVGPRTQLDVGAADLPTVPAATTQLPAELVPGTWGTTTRSAVRGGTPTRAPPA